MLPYEQEVRGPVATRTGNHGANKEVCRRPSDFVLFMSNRVTSTLVVEIQLVLSGVKYIRLLNALCDLVIGF